MRALLFHFGLRGVLSLCLFLAVSACGRNPVPDIESAISHPPGPSIGTVIVPHGGGDGIGIELLPMVGCTAPDGTRVSISHNGKGGFNAFVSSGVESRTVSGVTHATSSLLFEGFEFNLLIESAATSGGPSRGHLSATINKSQIEKDVTCRLSSIE